MLKPESLPEGWTARFDAEHGRREYTNETGDVQYVRTAKRSSAQQQRTPGHSLHAAD